MGADTTAIKNQTDERNPMNMTIIVGKHRFGKRHR